MTYETLPPHYFLSDYVRRRSPARRCLMFDPIPVGCCARYDIDDGEAAIFLASKEKAYDGIESCRFRRLARELYLPQFEFARKFTTTDRDSLLKAAKAFVQYEQDVLVSMLTMIGDDRIIASDCEAARQAFNDAHRLIERHDGCVCTIVTHPETLKRLAPHLSGFYNGRRIYTADVLEVYDPRLLGRAYCLAERHYVGVVAERQAMTCMELPDGEESVAFYDVGFALVNAGTMVSGIAFRDAAAPSISAGD